MSDVNEKLLEEKLGQLIKKGVGQKSIDFIKKYITQGINEDLFKINAFKIAQEAGIEKSDSVKLFLDATKEGVFDLNWDVHCPKCNQISFDDFSLQKISEDGHCDACKLDFANSFDETIIVSFTINPNIKEIDKNNLIKEKNKEFASLKHSDIINIWPTGAYVSSLQEFRDLFSSEMLSPDVTLSIKTLAVMFTDIKGSTALYERLGDAKAFTLVKDHFKILETVVRVNNGAVVKTIGDAIMAVFSNSVDSIKTAYKAYKEFNAFNKGKTKDNEIIIKLGIHEGPCIAVTSNEKLDYFGRTVNIASRIQGLSDGNKFVISKPLKENELIVEEILKHSEKIGHASVNLKGFIEKFDVFFIDVI